MLIDENARASRCSPLWYATNERIEGLVQHEVFSPTRLVCHFYDAYECNNCIRRSTAAGERWKMRRGERKKERRRGRGTTHGFVPKMGGERADASSFFAWFVHAQHRPRASCLFAVPSPSLLPSCPLLPAYSILNDFSTWQAMIGLETLRISRKTAFFIDGMSREGEIEISCNFNLKIQYGRGGLARRWKGFLDLDCDLDICYIELQ